MIFNSFNSFKSNGKKKSGSDIIPNWIEASLRAQATRY